MDQCRLAHQQHDRFYPRLSLVAKNYDLALTKKQRPQQKLTPILRKLMCIWWNNDSILLRQQFKKEDRESIPLNILTLPTLQKPLFKNSVGRLFHIHSILLILFHQIYITVYVFGYQSSILKLNF